MNDLSGSFHPYSKDVQLSRGPKRGKISKAEQKKAYKDSIEESRDPTTGAVLCYLCGEPCLEGGYAMDHVTPRGRRGKTTKENVRPSHPDCHDTKHLTN